MKKTIYTLLAMLSLATGIAAQNYLYIYRNDGQFDAFRKADIDSITWSRQDAEGREQQSWQAQQVHTAAGVIRIPLSAIDHAATPQPAVGEAVDLGLSVKWASHNVGAASPEQYGEYYAWGETEEKAVYSLETYAYYNSNTGYNIYIGNNIGGTQYDVARVKWGGKWRMPTADEIKELIDKCTWKWTTYKGVKGHLVTGPNGNFIFLPAAGSHTYENFDSDGVIGYYWSGTHNPTDGCTAYDLAFYPSNKDWSYVFCEYGFSVRPVIGETIEIKVKTGEAASITANTALVSGYASGLENTQKSCDLGILYGRSEDLTASTSMYVSSGQKTDGDFSVSLTGLKENTTYYYRARLALDGVYHYGEVRSFTTKEDGPTEGEVIDLGLSVKWASHNVGAASPEQAGGYYAWGETNEKTIYNIATYAHYDSQSANFINIGNNISGTQYDVAHAKWGGAWRMPTLNEGLELINKCIWKWTQYKGVNGYMITGPNGNSIFLPVTGNPWNDNPGVDGTGGFYWAGTIVPDAERFAYGLKFGSDGKGWYQSSRVYGRTVRPVTK